VILSVRGDSKNELNYLFGGIGGGRVGRAFLFRPALRGYARPNYQLQGPTL
jgi:hypothetical protein